ncbi:unnamed protein product [Toxocara canis]|uniref:Secreted protein n=1 Tax=Toxocara canis TaxID=6265 RepID=A0A183U7N2_TOXCA|nr:unnamed protein product [Toxocara canis]
MKLSGQRHAIFFILMSCSWWSHCYHDFTDSVDCVFLVPIGEGACVELDDGARKFASYTCMEQKKGE